MKEMNKDRSMILLALLIAGLLVFLNYQMKKDRLRQEKVRANQMARNSNLNQATKEYVESIRRRNKERLARVAVGMDQAQVLKIMGESHISLGSPQRDFKIDSPWRIESIKGKNGVELTVAYYYTEFIHADGQVNGDELTPLIFKDDKVVGRGWDIYHDLVGH